MAVYKNKDITVEIDGYVYELSEVDFDSNDKEECQYKITGLELTLSTQSTGFCIEDLANDGEIYEAIEAYFRNYSDEV